MFVVNNNRILLSSLNFFDDPEVSCILGLDFIECVCPADKSEIWGRKKPAFFLGIHHCFPLYPARNTLANMYQMAFSPYPILSPPLLQKMSFFSHVLYFCIFNFLICCMVSGTCMFLNTCIAENRLDIFNAINLPPFPFCTQLMF